MPAHTRLLSALLGRGYFPKELPPPFATRSFAAVCLSGEPLPAAFQKQKLATPLCEHILAQPGNRRRTLALPNPVTQHALAALVAHEWASIKAFTDESEISLSKPRTSRLRALEPTHPLAKLPEHRAMLRTKGRYLVRADVAQFYPSVYTHSIAWALHGLSKAKRFKNDKALLGNRLDRAIRNTQDQQTKGIPIGPDTSLVAAEIILSRVDNRVMKDSALSGMRHMDDFEFPCADHAEAARVQASVEEALRDYQLAPNSEKTGIKPLPQVLEYPWVSELRSFRIAATSRAQHYDLLRLFDRAVELAAAYPAGNILKYAIRRMHEAKLHRDNKGFFQSVIFQAINSEHGVLPLAVEILGQMQADGFEVDLDALANVLAGTVTTCSQTRLASEVSWALWAAIRFDCQLTEHATTQLAEWDDSVVCLLALDARERGLVPNGAALDRWKSMCAPNALTGRNWLLAYEAPLHGWLEQSHFDDDKQDEKSEAYDFLAQNEARFYDSDDDDDDDDDDDEHEHEHEHERKREDAESLTDDSY